jgi:pimeloyl-ACP methyl ester carboxylesterase
MLFSTYHHPDGTAIEYFESGSGNHTVVAFHGYGRSMLDFEGLDQLNGKSIRLIAINLPFHGKSSTPRRPDNYALKPLVILDFLSFMNARENLTLMGYSLGGRIALHLVQLIPQRIHRLILISPDGISFNPWYYFASQTRTGRWLHRQLFYDSSLILNILNAVHRFGLSASKLHKFAVNNYRTRRQRVQVFRIWEAHRKFSPSPARVREAISRHQIQTDIFLGKYERIIPRKPIVHFAASLPDCIHLHDLDAGHLPDFRKLWKQL